MAEYFVVSQPDILWWDLYGTIFFPQLPNSVSTSRDFSQISTYYNILALLIIIITLLIKDWMLFSHPPPLVTKQWSPTNFDIQDIFLAHFLAN